MNTIRKIDPAYAPAADLFAGRVVLVTGAGSGIGAAVVTALAQAGAEVILLGRTVRKLEAVYDDIEAVAPGRAAIYPMDLGGATATDFANLAAHVEQGYGRLDGLLHNASLLGSLSPIEHYDLQDWAKLTQVNQHAPFLLTQATLPLLKKSADASLVFTSSGVGRAGRAYWGAYSVTKFAIEGLSQVLAAELEQNTTVRVNTINPGAVRTPMRAAAYPAENPTTLITPGQVANRYLFLLGPASKGLTGERFDAQ